MIKNTSSFPVGTLAINVLGSFLIGFFVILSLEKNILSVETKNYLTIGLLGGFTTFSAFSLETLLLLEARQFLNAVFYIGFSTVFGVLSAWFGMLCARII